MKRFYHNPKCRKSREALALLQNADVEFEVIEYLKYPPKLMELKEILSKLGIPASDLIRKGEDEFKTQYKGKSLTEEEWLTAMVAHPKLIERPIFISNDSAVIGRPPEKVLALI